MDCWDTLLPQYPRLVQLMNRHEDLLDTEDDADFETVMSEINSHSQLYAFFIILMDRFDKYIEDKNREFAGFYLKHGKFIFERMANIYRLQEMANEWHRLQRRTYDEDDAEDLDIYDDFSVWFGPADPGIAINMFERIRSLAYKANQINRVHETCIRNST